MRGLCCADLFFFRYRGGAVSGQRLGNPTGHVLSRAGAGSPSSKSRSRAELRAMPGERVGSSGLSLSPIACQLTSRSARQGERMAAHYHNPALSLRDFN